MASRLEQRMFIHLVLIVSAICAIGGTSARAALTVDLRFTATSSGTVVNPKEVLFTGGIGDTVTMDVFATIGEQVNGNPDDDFIVFLHGSFLSSTGGLAGDLRAQLVPQFVWFSSSNGLQQDLDGDGDLDVGSNNPAHPANFFRANVVDDLYVWHAKIPTLTWTRTAGETGQALLNFRPRVHNDGGLWWIDGYGFYADQDEFLAGEPVQIKSIPELSSISIVLCVIANRCLGRHRR